MNNNNNNKTAIAFFKGMHGTVAKKNAQELVKQHRKSAQQHEEGDGLSAEDLQSLMGDGTPDPERSISSSEIPAARIVENPASGDENPDEMKKLRR